MDKKKKLFRQIFLSMLMIIFLCLVLTAFYSTSYFKKFFLDQMEQELTTRASLLQVNFSDMFENSPGQNLYIDQYCRKIGRKTGTRITVVLPSGQVLGDSFADIETMDNHMKRPEIMQALQQKKGVAIRYSSTLKKNMMYIALPIVYHKDVAAVVRTSVSVSVIDDKITTARNQIFTALFFIIAAAAVASLFVTRKITQPVEEMKKGAEEFAKGNLNMRLAIPGSEELDSLAATMNQMAQNLEETIREAKNRSSELEAVHASMHEGVIALGKDERIITMNRAAAKILDFPGLKPEGRYVLEIARNVEFQQFLENALATHEPVEQEIVITRNRVQVLHIHSSVLYDTNRKRMGTLIIFHDITRLKTLETMQKDFAANVSHELKTPLTTIKGFIETVQQILHTKPPQESEKFLKIIEKNVNRMIDLINDLSALSRLERLQGTTVQFESQNISSLIGSAVTTLSQALLQKNITVNIACDQDLSAGVDPVLLQQAVINLVDNAVKYSFQGQSIDIEVTTQKDCLNIVVRDKGSGIAKEHQSKIFNRFYRVDKARSRHEGGTGLGLAIVKHIVQYHNGDITVQSRNNKGARFQITLPLFE